MGRDWKYLLITLVACLVIFSVAYAVANPEQHVHGASDETWIELPSQYPPSMVRFFDKETRAVCYLIPGRYEGLGVVYSPALSCLRIEPR